MTALAITDELYKRVPKDPLENLEYRRRLCQAALTDDGLRRDIWMMCARDPLYWINAFVWTLDPRRTPSELPFITYEFQDDAIRTMVESIATGGQDLVIEKSRDMGASWCCLMVFAWFWQFRDLCTFLLVSRKESLVDERGNPDCLMAKLDFIHERLPKWLRPDVERKLLHLGNRVTGSTIDGESTTGDVGRGGRRTAILLDEFAAVNNNDGYQVLSSSRDVTHTRIFNSTPKGTNNAHYKVIQSGCTKLRFHWSQHPEKAAGMYTTEDKKLKILDQRFPVDYEPILDGKLRSPWYDLQCRRSPTSWEIAQELDIDYLGSNFQYFDSARIEELKKEYSRRPFLTGELDFATDSIEPKEFMPNPKGRLKLWVHPDAAGKLPEDRTYVLGADISLGTGASNSSIIIGDVKTNEMVGELTATNISPTAFAKYGVALAKWFNNALMIWEGNGPGMTFGNTVIETGYRNIHYRREERSITKKQSTIPGWWSGKESRASLIADFRQGIDSGDFIVRSEDVLEECHSYIVDDTGAIVHSGASDRSDPTGARENHGDRVIAAALTWMRMKSKRTEKKTEPQAPYASYAWRVQRRRKQERAKSLY